MLKASLNAPAEEAHDASATSTPGGLVATITGRQSDGALAEVMQVLGGNQDQAMLDFAQLVVRDRFIAVAVLAPDSNAGVSTSSDTVKDIIFRSHAAGFQIDFDACRGSSLSLSSSSSGALSSLSLSDKGSFGDEFIVTMCSLVRIPAKFVADATRILAEQGANIVSINRLTEEDDIYMCIEMVIKLPEGSSTFPSLRRSLFQLGRTQNSPDIAVQKARVTRTAKRIVVFDLSWTLVQCDAIDILLESAGVEPSEPDSEAYRQGKFSGPDWIRNRVLALHGADADKTNTSAIRSLCYTDGAKQLCQGLKRLGCRLAVVSSGSKLIAEQAKEHLGLHFAYGNIFEVDSRHKFTGLVREPIIDAQRKADLLQMLAMQEGVDTEQIIAVGDGPVSSKMLSAAGMSIAFDQPGSVDDVQSGRISSRSLASVFYLLGVTGRDYRELNRPVL